MNELEKNLQTAISRGNAAVNAQYELMRSGSRDVEIENGETVPSIDKRLEGMVGAVTSVNGQTGAIDIGFESLGLGSAARYDASDLPVTTKQKDYFIAKIGSYEELKSTVGKSGDSIQLTSYMSGANDGGGLFVYDESKKSINDGGMVINGWVRQDKKVKFSYFGATGGADDTAALTKACSYLSANGGCVDDYSGKTYNYNGNLSIVADGKYLEFNGNVTLNALSGYFLIIGALTEIGSIAAQANAGMVNITLSSSDGLSANDIIVIENKLDYSFSQHRNYYHDGEYSEIKNIVNNSLVLKSGLISNYSAASSNVVYKLNPVKVKFNGISFLSNGVYSLRLKHAANCDIKLNRVINTSESSASSAALAIDKCFNINLVGGEFYKKYNVGTATDYGIGVFNCQNVTIDCVNAFGGRHAVSTGGDASDGAVPNRFIYILNSALSNDVDAGIYCADFHGNTADSYYKACNISGRIGLAGNDTSAIDCFITGIGATNQPVLGYHETNKGKMEFLNCTAVVSSESTALSVISNLSSALTAKIMDKYSIVSKGCKFIINDKVTQIINALDNSGKSNSWVLDSFNISGVATGLTSLVKFSFVSGGIDPDVIEVTNPSYKVPESLPLVSRSGTALTNTAFKFFASSGSNANGDWRKLSDGTMICNFIYTASAAISVAYNGGFRSGGINWTFPLAFKSAPAVTITPLNGSCFGGAVSTLTASICQFFALSVTSQSNASRSLSLQAIGRWGVA